MRHTGSLGRGQRLSCVLLALVRVVRPWISTSQSRFGATISGIYNESLGMDLATPLSIARQQSLGYLWSLPYDPIDTRGLGGSVTWAWDESLCERMLPLIKDDFWAIQLVNCATMKETMHRAFDTWAMNHRHIKFTDVSDRCAEAGQLNKNCTIAEIWVTFDESDTYIEPAYSMQTAPEDFPTDFRATNGERPTRFFSAGGFSHPVYRPVAEVQRATIAFQTRDICWYLDSKFCEAWHRSKGFGSENSQAVRHASPVHARSQHPGG